VGQEIPLPYQLRQIQQAIAKLEDYAAQAAATNIKKRMI
jgi:hypothetical protein